MKILIVTPHLNVGGISSSLFNLVTKLTEKKEDFDITLFLFNPHIEKKFKNINQSEKIRSSIWITYCYISFAQAKRFLKWYQFPLYLLFKTFQKTITSKRLRKFILKLYREPYTYDTAISFSNDIPASNTFLGSNFFVINSVSAHQKIAWIHNDIDKLGMDKNYLIKEYRHFNKIVNVSKSCKQRFEELVPEYKEKSVVFNNYINPGVIQKKALLFNPYEKNLNYPIIVTVARIDNKQKRIDRILSIVQKLKNKNIRFKWHIIGSGSDLNNFIVESKRKKVDDVLFFEGFKSNPYPYVFYADLFVLTSDYEAQGMVLSESLLLHTPVVTTDFDAAKEFVADQYNGIICKKSTESLYHCIENLLTQPELLNTLNNNIKKSTVRDNQNIVFEQFRQLINA